MNRFEAKKKLCDYLKRNQIPFQESVDNGTIQLTMVYRGFAPCPGGILESCIWFYEDCMEVRVYYNEIAASICKASEFKAPLFRFFNFINARVWPRAADGMDSALYNPHHLHVPRIYMSEDSYFDIMLTSVIAYDFYEVAMLETEDYITGCCPELLNELSTSIFGILLGKLDVDQAIRYVKADILKESGSKD